MSQPRFCDPATWVSNIHVVNGQAVGDPYADGWVCCMCRKPNLDTPKCVCGHGRCAKNTNPTRFDRPEPL